MLAAGILVLLFSPALVLAFALLRAIWLFWPTMILLGAVHSYLPFVPALGWVATFWVIALLGVIVPTGSSTSTPKTS